MVVQDCTCCFMIFHMNECYRVGGAARSRTGRHGKGRRTMQGPAQRIADFTVDFDEATTVSGIAELTRARDISSVTLTMAQYPAQRKRS